MIDRIHLKSLLGFESVTLEFESGLVVFSGPSGAGKSVLMGSILANFGILPAEAKLCELILNKPDMLQSDLYELDEELVVRGIKKDRTRYYLNDQNISRKALRGLFSPFVDYLSVRDNGGFENAKLLDMLDSAIANSDLEYKKTEKEYKKRYKIYRQKKSELGDIRNREQKLTELIEFANFEINKIKDIDPKVGEDEDLLVLKKQLSKIDKINNALAGAEEIFAFESSVADVLSLIEKDGEYFYDAMNRLRADFEDGQSLMRELEDTDVESLLNRLEQITELKNRYGSIEDALAYRATKEKELAGYQRIEEDKSVLERFIELESIELAVIARRITEARIAQSDIFSKKLDSFLSRLKLPAVNFVFSSVELSEDGMDSVELHMQDRGVDTLSGGEHNRLRLALMVVAVESKSSAGGVVILDEIDANVSGDESIAIAEMISVLSKQYQIFAISHQPHLASKADQHILIDRHDGKSSAHVLDERGRVTEISRIIGGEIPSQEAEAFAKKLLG